MLKGSEDKAFYLVEKAVMKAQKSLEKSTQFQPFYMLLNETGNVEVVENEIEDSVESYAALEKQLSTSILEDIEVLVLVIDTATPTQLGSDVSTSIRIHLEEKSKIDEPLAARFLFVPYSLHKNEKKEISVKLFMPEPIGFPSQYLVK